MEGGTFQLRWEEDGRMGVSTGGVVSEEIICGLDGTQSTSYPSIAGVQTIADTDQIAAENLMYLAQDVVGQLAGYMEVGEAGAGPEVECVTEEVITDDWVQPGGQERVEVPMEQLTCPPDEMKVEDDVDVPLPTDQDEYTAMRPYPCDFCSRRFRKKAALMNHMVAHQNDRPHGCNLCGMRYVRKSDLMHHLKTHAFVPESEQDYDDLLQVRKKKKSKRKRATPKVEENGVWENMTSARTQQWSRPRPAPAPAPEPTPPPPPPALSPSPPPRRTPSPPPTPPPPADPRRPFVCSHCGVGFAREKALQSHSRIHGGDSPLECGTCGDLCWSREALAAHTRSRHPHLAPAARAREPSPYQPSDSSSYDDELEYSRSATEPSPPLRTEGANVAPELYCRDCGVAFQRADLLRRHVVAAHSYKRHDSETMASDISGTEHTCDVCGETCTDALQLLAHAELHARDNTSRNKRTSTGRHFPCHECGKVFGSRSSQQIHVRIHTGERPYACRFCWKAFADGGTLRKHERIHTGEKPYACAVCPRAFNQRVVLREHVRSHHSAPDSRRAGSATYGCAVCGCTLPSSSELIQHLIEHCDANTALRRQPQVGPRKYKRRRRVKQEARPESPAEWGADASPATSPHESPAASPPPPPPRARHRPRRPRRVAPPPRPKMIHTSEEVSRPRTKNVRSTVTAQRVAAAAATFPLLSAEPADDLRAILPQLKQEVEENAVEVKCEPSAVEGPYRCEMCSLQFRRRDELLLHVPVHI